MKIVFMGTPRFAAKILFELAQHHDVCAVYTREDAIRGRGKELIPTEVKVQACELGIPVHTPRSFKDEAALEQLRSYNPDVIIVAAYGMLLPKSVLDLPRYGCLNAHASELPRWRGAAPVERAILAGDRQAGVCVMRMEEGLDTGDYCICRSTDIADKTALQLTDELADLASQALLSALVGLEAGHLFWTKQDESLVSYAHKIAKYDLYLNAEDSVQQALRKIRCVSEAHASKIILAGKSISLLSAAPSSVELGVPQASSVLYQGKKLYLACSDGYIELLEVKPDGKKAMPAKAFAAGLQAIAQNEMKWESICG